MDKVLEVIETVNSFINGIVWGWPMVILILGTGILLTIRTKFLQVRKFGTSMKQSVGSTFKSIGKKKKNKNESSISPFEAFATAISGTVGTGNIIGVTSAIMTGGPGAVFWMWISAFFGMVTNFSENVLGMYFRKKSPKGEFAGGAMYYLSEGLPLQAKTDNGRKVLGTIGKVLGFMAALFCALAAIGMGGTQTNKIAGTITSALPQADAQLLSLAIGVLLAVVLAIIIIGGVKRIGKVCSILVPFMSLLFIIMALIIIFANITLVGSAFALIFKNIFSFQAAVGGGVGFAFAQIIQKGLARGIFSNEAGLGSSVIAHSASEAREPMKQGFWGIFEVFFDTFIICTLTALFILVSFGNDMEVLYSGSNIDTQVSMLAFNKQFGTFGTIAYSVIIPLFGLTTIIAWSYYGEKAVEYLFRKTGEKGKKISILVFKIIYLLLVVVAAIIDGELAWAISDTFNGLMALPNLIGLVIMSGLVVKISKNYFRRKKGEDVEPMLSAYPEQNAQFIKDEKNSEGSEKEISTPDK
ncbi:MAG: alanine/glycine:cation symporter family protein [Candidatus Coproplasma sp.]